MGFVTSAIGFGGALGQFAMPTLSDFIGRKISDADLLRPRGGVHLAVHRDRGREPGHAVLAAVLRRAVQLLGALATLAGPVAAEAAPVGMIASVAGLVIGAGEIFGGGVAPIIGGHIAQNHGIQYTLWFALGGQLLGILIALLLKETAPRKVGAGTSGVRVSAYSACPP